ncbi:hypothetical protein PF001_g15126 [Phytophthora fragariae]|uniref:Uncharacterized protein n=1 Tax=Phytophthora fragariae TaxID=53985 RepID=A0A6A4D242_9STRA|nr:hypothetical protein PF001_g15126 [Phytophthora fragariae]
MELTIPLPESISCRLFIKNGQPYASGRNKVPPSPSFVLKVAEGYRVLRAKVEEHFENKLPGQWRPDFVLYFKPTNNASQKDFQVLCSDGDALRVQLDMAWYKARLRKNEGQAGFMLELYIYVPKPVEPTTKLRRATAARIQEQMPRVAVLLRKQGIAAGPATQNYMAVTQARLPDGAPLAVPDNTTFRQLQQVDAQQAAMDEAMQGEQQLANAEYHLVCVKIQDVPVATQVNISDIRAALGLPSCSLRPPFSTAH